MKVTLINHSDCRGGASVVTMRLTRALRAAGVDARMIVARADGARPRPPYVDVAAGAVATTAAFLLEEGLTWIDNGLRMKGLFALDAARAGLPLERHPWVKDADVVCLNWVNQGMLSLRGVERIAALGKPVVWTMHDMWNATGLCHHAGECRGYQEQCGCCPLLHCHRHFNDLSHRRYMRKMSCYDRSGIAFVAVSSWLAERCRESGLMRGRRVEVIPNAFPVDEFGLEPRHSRAELGLPADGRAIVVMGAARLDDPVKGLPMAVATLNRVADMGYGDRVLAVFFGGLRDAHALDGVRLPHVHVGMVQDAARLRSLYAHARVVLSTSLYETLPGTLIEGQAAGAYPVSFDRGGQRDIVDSPRTGLLAEYGDTEALAAGIVRAVDAEPDVAALRASVESRFSAPAVAARYMELFESVC